MISILSVRGRITVTATALFAVLLLAISALILSLVENDVRSAAEDALQSALNERALAGSPRSSVIEDTSFSAVIGGLTYDLGLFDELSEGNASGELSIDGELTAVLEIDLRTKRVVQVFDPDSGLPISDTLLLAQLQELTFDVLDIDGDAGSSLLVGAAEMAEIDSATAAVRRALLATVPLLVLVFAAMTWFMVGRSLRPVAAITGRVNEITTTSLDQRVPVPGGRDEVAQLAIVVNQMLDRLETGDLRQRQFASDASHELRSPLSAMRVAAELVGLHTEDERTSELVNRIMGQSDRMDELVTDLLELSRSADLDLATRSVICDLGAVVRSVADGHGVELDGVGSVHVGGDVAQLGRLIQNLIENAQRHATAEVAVGLARTGEHAEITVEDDGPGIDPTDRERIFERFTRLDDSRSRSDGGFGLGLALAQSIAVAHGGRITVDRSPTLGGGRFVVRLPLASSADLHAE